jgi:hypothetical protein
MGIGNEMEVNHGAKQDLGFVQRLYYKKEVSYKFSINNVLIGCDKGFYRRHQLV